MKPDRAKLGFPEAVLSAFEFLRVYDFRVVRIEPTLVRFESPSVFVNIYHGRSSFQLGFEIGMRNSKHDEDWFSLEAIIDPNERRAEETVLLQASTPESVAECVRRLASMVQRHAGQALAGDASVFRKFAQNSARISEDLHRAMDLTDARESAERAWRQKDYRGVVTAYEPVRDYLTPAETKKLQFAEKHLSD